MDSRKLLGKRIRELRKKNGLNQEELAERVGLESTSISNIENGYNYPTIQNLEKIVGVLNTKLKDIFTFEHHKENNNLIDEIVSILKNNPEKIKDYYKIVVALAE